MNEDQHTLIGILLSLFAVAWIFYAYVIFIIAISIERVRFAPLFRWLIFSFVALFVSWYVFLGITPPKG